METPIVAPIMPRYGFGQLLRARRGGAKGFVGRVNTIYEDFASVINSFTVNDDWWDAQAEPPSTPHQVFYAIEGIDQFVNRGVPEGYRSKRAPEAWVGEILVGENDVEPVTVP